MDYKEIEDLIRAIAASGATEVEIEAKDIKLIVKNSRGTQNFVAEQQQVVAQVMPMSQPAIQQVVQSVPQRQEVQVATKAELATTSEDSSRYIKVKSPMVGTFYRRANPQKPAYVNVGDEIQVGKVIGIIEAMKLFNEIESEVSGKIVKILVEDATPVEFDQPIYLVDPS